MTNTAKAAFLFYLIILIGRGSALNSQQYRSMLKKKNLKKKKSQKLRGTQLFTASVK